jgi:hypothetical protein
VTAPLFQLIEPSEACRRLGHRLEYRAKIASPGQWEYCFICSLGYERAMTALGDEEAADRFVQMLRRG